MRDDREFSEKSWGKKKKFKKSRAKTEVERPRKLKKTPKQKNQDWREMLIEEELMDEEMNLDAG